MNKYKGIVIFGPPGSGKSTVARLLRSSLPASELIEASQAVIFPAASLVSTSFPKSKQSFISQIINTQYTETGKKISRKEARNIFLRIKKDYSPSIVAKTLIRIHNQKWPC